MNCTEHPRFTNGYHHNTAFECFPMALPLASTYNCMRDGDDHRIAVSGKHFEKSDAIVTIDGVECLEVVHVVPETELECLLPPASSQWLANPVYPSKVRVQNGQLHDLADKVALLSYVAPVRALPIPIVLNVAAHALDVNWAAPSDIWEAMTVTGYRVRWKKCTDAGYSEASEVILGNVTSTTLIALERNTSYQVQVTVLTEDYRERQRWQDLDLYGRRAMLENAVLGLESPSSTCTTALTVSKVSDNGAGKTEVRLYAAAYKCERIDGDSTYEAHTWTNGGVGNQDHFGLYVNGHTNPTLVYNPDAVGSETASCTFVSSETETRVSTYINRKTDRSQSTNASHAIPFPAKTIRSFNSSLPNGASAIAPVTGSCGPALRLTSSLSFLTGSAWYPRQMNVREGFETTFTFCISNPSTFCKNMDDMYTNCRSRGGDGFAFVVQSDHELAIGDGGMELGYGGLRNALAVEFDTWFNYEQLDVYKNHVSVHASGKNEVDEVRANHTYALGATSNILDLTDGQHLVKIRYDPNLDDGSTCISVFVAELFEDHFVVNTCAGHFFASGGWASGIGVLSVFVDNMETAILSVPLRIDDTIELEHGRAWVGFTTATGETAWQTQDILSWNFESLRRDIVFTEQVPG
ncbi:Lectin domain-containing protein, partial [Globisporangium splendens]